MLMVMVKPVIRYQHPPPPPWTLLLPKPRGEDSPAMGCILNVACSSESCRIPKNLGLNRRVALTLPLPQFGMDSMPPGAGDGLDPSYRQDACLLGLINAGSQIDVHPGR